MNIFSRQATEKSPEKIFQGLRMYHIDQKFDGTDKGYQSHQLLTESDMLKRQMIPTKKGATPWHEVSLWIETLNCETHTDDVNNVVAW